MNTRLRIVTGLFLTVGVFAPLAGCEWCWSCESAVRIEVVNTESGDPLQGAEIAYAGLAPIAEVSADGLDLLSDPNAESAAVTNGQGIALLSARVVFCAGLPPVWSPNFCECGHDGLLADRVLLLLPGEAEPKEISLEPGTTVVTELYTIRVVEVGPWDATFP